MRRPWIKIEICTPDKPEVCSLATQLRMDSDAVVGKLVRLWSWAEVNRIDPNDLGVTNEFIDKLVARKGFAQALEKTGWLIETGEKLSFRNFKRHNSPVAQNKALTAKRVARHRLRKSAEKGEVTIDSLSPPTVRKVSKLKKLQISDDSKIVINSPESLNTSNLSEPEVALPVVVPAPTPAEVVAALGEAVDPIVETPVEAVEEPIEVVSEVAPDTVSNLDSASTEIPIAAQEETVTHEPAADVEPIVASAPEEPVQRKRRTKAVAAADDQPMLF